MNKNETALMPQEETTLQTSGHFNDAFFDQMESLSDDKMSPTEAEYLEFEEGVIHNLIFTGFTEATFGEENKESVCFQGKGGWRYINSNSVILNAMKRLSAPCPVRITCVGEKKNSKGNKYKDFKIFTL